MISLQDFWKEQILSLLQKGPFYKETTILAMRRKQKYHYT